MVAWTRKIYEQLTGSTVEADTSRAAELLDSALGKDNPIRVTGTGATTPDAGFVFCAIQAETDVVIATGVGNVTNLDGAAIGQEGLRYFRLTSITLTSGTAWLYQVPE